MKSPALRLRSIEASDAPGLIALARAAFGTTWTEAFVAWKYFDNPAGAAFGGCAESDGRVVASYSNIPLRLKLGAQVVTAAQAVDAMVLEAFRRQKLFYQLARQTYQAMDAQGVGPTYVFPAPAIHAAFVKQLAYADVGPVPRFVKVVDAGQFSAGRRPARAGLDYVAWAAARLRHPSPPPSAPAATVQVSTVAQFDARFDRLWQQASRDFPIATVRDAAYLTWRYQHNPQQDYVIVTAVSGDDLLAYAVLSIDRERRIVQVAELIVAPGEELAAQALLRHVTDLARQAGCAQIQCWMLPQHDFYVRLLERSGYVYWPVRVAPGWLRYVTPFVLRTAPGQTWSLDPQRLENWFISMGDHDYY